MHLATLRAGPRRPAILCFESPSATSEFSPQVFVDIDDHVEVIEFAIKTHDNQKIYDNQKKKPYITAGRVYRQGSLPWRPWKQRVRWARGLIQTIRNHRAEFLTPFRPMFHLYLRINVFSQLIQPDVQLLALYLVPVLIIMGIGTGVAWASGLPSIWIVLGFTCHCSTSSSPCFWTRHGGTSDT